MTAEFVRDAAATAAVFGFFASAWFGWAQEAPPASWRKVLIAGSILSLLTAIAGGLLAWQHWTDGTVFDRDTSRSFGIIVGIEFAVAGLGAGLLHAWKKADFVAPWVASVVGVHLFPLAGLLGYPLLYVVASLISLIALAALPLGKGVSLRRSAFTGLATGSVLLLAALSSLITVFV
jgi:hypothetical protein